MVATNYAGKQVGGVLVIRRIGSTDKGVALWEALCPCGELYSINSQILRQRTNHSCKACKRHNLIGKVFDNLTVVALGSAPPRVGSYNKHRSAPAYWSCICKCGTVKDIKGGHLRAHTTISCGCVHASPRIANNGAAWNAVVGSIRSSADNRGIDWSLTTEEALSIVTKPCFYCGREPFQIRTAGKRKHSSVKYSGIDRIDSSKGYKQGNIVPACGMCNKAKNALSVEQFKSWVNLVHNHWARKAA